MRSMRTLLVLASLAVLTTAAHAKRVSVWAGEWEYKFDDKKIAKAEVERVLVLAEHGTLLGDAIAGDEVGKLWLHRKSNDWTKWSEWGPAWVKTATASQAQRQTELAELEAMTVPAELVPVKTHLVQQVRFFLEREALALRLLADDKPTLPAQTTVGGIDPAKTCATQLDKVLKASDRGARIEALSYSLGNCLNGARASDYPATAWKKFLAKYRIREQQHTEMNGP